MTDPACDYGAIVSKIAKQPIPEPGLHFFFFFIPWEKLSRGNKYELREKEQEVRNVQQRVWSKSLCN